MVIIQLLSVVLLHSVNDIKKPILSVDDVERCHIISKNIPAQDADTQLPDSENVLFSLFRRLVFENSRS